MALQSFIETAGPRSSGSTPGEATTSSASRLSAAAADTTGIATSTGGGVKSLTIDLDPGHLGPVSITMRLKGDAMSIQIAVNNPETLRLLDRDKHLLTAAVVATGGSSDALRIGTNVTGDGIGQSAGSFGQPSFGDPSGRQAAFSSDASSAGRQGQSNSRQDSRSEFETSHDDPTTPSAPPSRSPDRSLYL